MLAGSEMCMRCGSGRNRRLHGTRYMTAPLIQLCVALYDAMHNRLGVLQLALFPSWMWSAAPMVVRHRHSYSRQKSTGSAHIDLQPCMRACSVSLLPLIQSGNPPNKLHAMGDTLATKRRIKLRSTTACGSAGTGNPQRAGCSTCSGTSSSDKQHAP